MKTLKRVHFDLCVETDLAAAFQHLLAEAHKPLSHLRMIQCQRQKVGERLLPSEAVNQNLNAGNGRDHSGLLRTCDH